MDEQAQKSGGLYRRSIMAMAVIGVLCYAVAFTLKDRGDAYYQQYVAGYTGCFQEAIESTAAPIDCNFVPEVRVHLAAHREAIAVGEPFFNLALSLTTAVLLSPLLRKLVAEVSNCISGDRAFYAAKDPT